jgi:hypothetical protein
MAFEGALTLCLLSVVVVVLVASEETAAPTKAPVTTLQIGVKKRPETCDTKTKNGDRLSMHYTVRSFLLYDVASWTINAFLNPINSHVETRRE